MDLLHPEQQEKVKTIFGHKHSQSSAVQSGQGSINSSNPYLYSEEYKKQLTSSQQSIMNVNSRNSKYYQTSSNKSKKTFGAFNRLRTDSSKSKKTIGRFNRQATDSTPKNIGVQKQITNGGSSYQHYLDSEVQDTVNELEDEEQSNADSFHHDLTSQSLAMFNNITATRENTNQLYLPNSQDEEFSTKDKQEDVLENVEFVSYIVRVYINLPSFYEKELDNQIELYIDIEVQENDFKISELVEYVIYQFNQMLYNEIQGSSFYLQNQDLTQYQLYLAKQNGAPKREYPKIRHGFAVKSIEKKQFSLVVSDQDIIEKSPKNKDDLYIITITDHENNSIKKQEYDTTPKGKKKAETQLELQLIKTDSQQKQKKKQVARLEQQTTCCCFGKSSSKKSKAK